MKANIDTAEMICDKKHVEFPALLRLARAKYFFLTNDYKSASHEADVALKKAKSSGETNVIIKTMNFLGHYSLRTGFFNEGIDYFTGSISLANKNNLKKFHTRKIMMGLRLFTMLLVTIRVSQFFANDD